MSAPGPRGKGRAGLSSWTTPTMNRPENGSDKVQFLDEERAGFGRERPPMISTISLGFIVDTASVLAASPLPSQDATSPTLVMSDHCFLIAPPTQARAGLASADLRLALRRQSVLRWQGLSLSGNTGQSVIIYALEQAGTGKGKGSGRLGPIVARIITQEMPQPLLRDCVNTAPPPSPRFHPASTCWKRLWSMPASPPSRFAST
ncbi:AidA/PixA family protein [Nitrospirillum sp. BR 11163]|uniref:AidA/PixA family protein n=1 Tax=Nitrospirillum sp. BR 11163 TaxID=3104323 RepID=UPI003A4C840A